MRAKSTISFIGLWERLHNEDFNCLEFEAIKNEAGDNGFVMTPSMRLLENMRMQESQASPLWIAWLLIK